MSHVNVTINGRQYRMACEEGQERRLLQLADSMESRVEGLRGKFGEIGDARLTVMAALTIADELLDANQRIGRLEEQLNALQDARYAASERAKATQSAISLALNSASERLEKMSQTLNRTLGGGIAIG
ncbi:cell division protein ZapA [Bradyrhizobium prioriisuperbiae]|uniref:cell division protein ZapA n=1 Tax=Bradyrhizobium prioriisuperbiae TaxID=2854389 RepID=UPI0028F08E40|nr:cell division protein ZapA [Bradyrhizobium prioritasuperba]